MSTSYEKYVGKGLISLLLIVFGMVSFQGVVRAQSPERLYVTVVGTEGDVEVKFPGQGWVPVKPGGMKLQEGVELRTGPFSHANLIFADNSIARVDSFSQLTIDSFVKTATTIKTHISLTVGSMTSTVNRGELINDYEIVTPTVTASVRGTQIKRITSGALFGDNIEMGDHGKLEFFDDIGLLHALLGGESSGAELTPNAPVGSTETTSIADSSLVKTSDFLSTSVQGTTDSGTTTLSANTGTLSTVEGTFTTTTASSDPYQSTTYTSTLSATDATTIVTAMDNTISGFGREKNPVLLGTVPASEVAQQAVKKALGGSPTEIARSRPVREPTDIINSMFSTLENFKVESRETYTPSSFTIPERRLYVALTEEDETEEGDPKDKDLDDLGTDGGERVIDLSGLEEEDNPVLLGTVPASEVAQQAVEWAFASREAREEAREVRREATETARERQKEAAEAAREARREATETARERQKEAAGIAREAAREAQSQVAEAAREAREEAREAAREAQSQVAEAAREAREEAREAAREAQGASRERQKQDAEEQKGQGKKEKDDD